MARQKRGAKSFCGCSLILQLTLAWLCLLGVAVVFANFYILQPVTGPQHPPDATHEVPHNSFHEQEVASKIQHNDFSKQEVASSLPKVKATEALPALRGAAPAEASAVSTFEDNCPRPPMKPSDREQAASGLQYVSGAKPGHLHGLLGRAPDGSWLLKPTPMPPKGYDKREAHKGQCYNAVVSDSLPLDRTAPDYRNHVCMSRHAVYQSVLPKASVVIVFHNEIASALLRSVHSVLNQSPPDLLLEVIMVDDASVPDPLRFTQQRWERLQGEMADYVKKLPKVSLVRLGERRGLMLARMEGAWRARADVVVFLDSHIEAAPGWLEPLLSRIKDDRKHVVVPNILGIGFDDFSYQGSSGLGVLSFSWTLGQRPQPANTQDGEFKKSPIMAGGLFASDRAFFMHLGGYDPEMKYYGGEEMEIGFRTWQCGGDIEFVPCSHVFHIFRQAGFWQGTDSAGVAYKVPGHEITRNKLRAAAVWMDEFEKFVQYASPPLPEGVTLGDLGPRKELRKKLKCKSFKWYLETVAKDVFVPRIDGLKAGSLKNKYLDSCFDTLNSDRPGLYPCHGQHGTQGLVMDGDGRIRIPLAMYEKCLSSSGARAVLAGCSRSKRDTQHWSLAPAALSGGSGLLREESTGTCIEAASKKKDQIPYSLRLAPCSEGKAEQQWTWQAW